MTTEEKLQNYPKNVIVENEKKNFSYFQSFSKAVTKKRVYKLKKLKLVTLSHLKCLLFCGFSRLN